MAMNTHQMAEAAKKNAGNADAEKEAAKKASPSQRAQRHLDKYMDMIKRSLGDKLNPLEFANAVVNAVATDPNLLKAMDESPASFIGAVLQAAILGLVPNTPLGHAYLIAYYAKDKIASEKEGRKVFKWQVNFQIGYRGVLELVHRSGELAYVTAETVYEKDYFDHMQGTERWLKHKPYDGVNPGRPIKFYALFKLKNGDDHFKVWSYDKVLDHAIRFSKSYDANQQKFFGPWGNNFEAMARKTVLLDVLNYAPRSTTLAAQLASDNTTKTLPANGSDRVNMLMMPNEDFEPQVDTAEVQQIAAEEVPQLEVQGDPQATANNVREQFGLKRGSDIAKRVKTEPKQSQLSVDDLI